MTTQAQILKLIRDLQTRRNMAVLFITHDFGVVAEIADRVLVLRHGRVVEEGPASAVLGRPQAAYTRTLLAAVPTMDPPSRPPLSGPKAVEVTGCRRPTSPAAACFAPSAARRRRGTSPSRSIAARPSASSANRARANPRSPASSCG